MFRHFLKTAAVIFSFLLVLVSVLPAPMQAQEYVPSQVPSGVTASHVYQSTEQLRLALEGAGLLDVAVYEEVVPDTALRHPRHVMQKVRECHQLFEKMLLAKNLEVEPMPRMRSFHEVTPQDVLNGVEHLTVLVEALSGTVEERSVAFVKGKLPVDVYSNLKKICHAVDADIEPADVYRVAVAVDENMKSIFEMRGDERALPERRKFSGKIPKDVYFETLLFLKELRTLAFNPDYAIPGGVVMPRGLRKGKILPQDVMALMNDALSGTEAVKYTLRLKDAASLPPYSPGKTPSDVFEAIYHARMIVRRLILQEEQLDREMDEP